MEKRNLDSIQDHVLSVFEELRQKDEALKEAMALLCDPFKVPDDWTEMPVVLQNDATALTQAIVSNKFVSMRRSEVSGKVLQRALPTLLENHRSAALKACEKGLLYWEEVNPTPSEWRDSTLLSMEAFRQGMVENSADSPALTKSMFANAVWEHHLLWNCIPTNLQDDLEFCRLVLNPEESEGPFDGGFDFVVMNIFERHPQLLQEHQVWQKLIINSPHGTVSTLFYNGVVPPHEDLIELACSKNNYILGQIDQIAFRGMVERLIGANANTLFFVSAEFVQTFPGYIESKLTDVQAAEMSHDFCCVLLLARKLPDSIWENESFVHTWFQKGLPLLSLHPEAWRSQREKLLLVARHSPNYYAEWSFHVADEELISDVEFITEVMRLDPCLFEYASETLRQTNYELAVWALGNRQFVKKCHEAIVRHQGERAPLTEQRFNECTKQVNADNKMHIAFVKVFLCAVCVSNGPRKHSELWRLNQRPYLENIADFVGLARGEHLRNVRNALATLSAVSRENQDYASGKKDTSNLLEQGSTWGSSAFSFIWDP